MPAPKLRPVLPSTTTTPWVMYSQPWSPTPSPTATAPLLRAGEPPAARAAAKQPPAGGAVENGIAHDHVLVPGEGGVGGRPHDDLAAGHALAHVVVRFALQHQAQAVGAPGAEALAGAALKAGLDSPGRQALQSVAQGDLAGDAGADGEVAVADGRRDLRRLPPPP